MRREGAPAPANEGGAGHDVVRLRTTGPDDANAFLFGDDGNDRLRSAITHEGRSLLEGGLGTTGG